MHAVNHRGLGSSDRSCLAMDGRRLSDNEDCRCWEAYTLSLLAEGADIGLLASLGRLLYRLHSCKGYPGGVRNKELLT